MLSDFFPLMLFKKSGTNNQVCLNKHLDSTRYHSSKFAWQDWFLFFLCLYYSQVWDTLHLLFCQYNCCINFPLEPTHSVLSLCNFRPNLCVLAIWAEVLVRVNTTEIVQREKYTLVLNGAPGPDTAHTTAASVSLKFFPLKIQAHSRVRILLMVILMLMLSQNFHSNF